MNQDELLIKMKEFLSYNPLTGIFHWIKPKKTGQKKGSIAGSVNNGYIRIAFDKKTYSSHRLAWFMYYGKWPNGLIDHKDRNKANNAISNLRECNHAENQQNIVKAQLDNKVGLIGAYLIKDRNKKKVPAKKFISSIRINKKTFHIGMFHTAQEAHNAYLAKKQELHPFYNV